MHKQILPGRMYRIAYIPPEDNWAKTGILGTIVRRQPTRVEQFTVVQKNRLGRPRIPSLSIFWRSIHSDWTLHLIPKSQEHKYEQA